MNITMHTPLKITQLSELPGGTKVEDVKLEINALDWRNLLLLRLDDMPVDVLIGMPFSEAYRHGPVYVTFINGQAMPVIKTVEDPYCGLDISDDTLLEDMIKEIRLYILEYQDRGASVRIYLRTGLTIESYPAEFDADGYHPAGKKAYTRIAFEVVTP